MNKTTITILFLGLSSFLSGQEQLLPADRQETVKVLTVEGQKIINSTLYQDRKKANEQFYALLKKAVQEDDSIRLDLRKVSNLMQVINNDTTLRILTWAILDAQNSYHYYGFIQRVADEQYFWEELNDQSKSITLPEKQELTSNNWYGCLYYDLLEIDNGLKTINTLVGWDGNNSMSHKKIIDHLFFDQNDSARFGAPIMREAKNAYRYRKIFEFSGDLKMTLDLQSAPKKRIVFDHLSPSNPSLIGVYEYYGPDLTFDAYEWGGRFWDYVSDIDTDQYLEKSKKAFEVKDRDTIQSKDLFTPY